MKSNTREMILRNLEFVCGGIYSLKALVSKDEHRTAEYTIFDEWESNLRDAMDYIVEDAEDDEDAE